MDYQVFEFFLEFLFWVSAGLIVYTYVGYGILLGLFVLIKRISGARKVHGNVQPTVSFIIAAYNEEEFIERKIANTLQLEYPSDKTEIIIVTEGSSDRTAALAASFQGVRVIHSTRRLGKTAALKKAVGLATGEILVFSDANALLTPQSLSKMMRWFLDKRVGGVAGEKRVLTSREPNGTDGEGMYWRYESALKRLDSNLNTIVGAAGELFAMRKKLWTELPDDTIIEDFVQSLNICLKGYSVKYEPDAAAYETPSESVEEEMKRKVRICAGAFQAMGRLRPLFNVFRYGLTSFQFISHRILRWTIAPLSMPILLLSNLGLVVFSDHIFYQVVLGLQFAFYFLAIMGWSYARQNKIIRWLNVPFYFVFMNVAVFSGLRLYLRGEETVYWERALRQEMQTGIPNPDASHETIT